MLTAGLLRVELAPEEHQLYSEGCGSRGQRVNKGNRSGHRSQRHAVVAANVPGHASGGLTALEL